MVRAHARGEAGQAGRDQLAVVVRAALRAAPAVAAARTIMLAALAATIAAGTTPVVLVIVVAAMFGVGEAFTDNPENHFGPLGMYLAAGFTVRRTDPDGSVWVGKDLQ